eukprot:CAMPEP_0176352828 /NCGR_PEP_ID=MMETSP0126-20121128/11344_1 /TAXON_ID=141414 ORGANISM="Strombidinopsis acuminatum, Strain SPMC142" /NCGR_SAMPLE_ID=MMETSP0126 /ASSEMBLY_ACC=CAM_ASM_000229 /LENGTH=77 /DNA_ID=CAMNT_0017704187 /DNA_START=1032 /DNA_END=1265 /DNA_ORIENTATION=+
MHTVLQGDIFRCIDRAEALNILNDPYAEEEMIRLLEAKYGPVKESFLFDYAPDSMISSAGVGTDTIKKDMFRAFESM